MRRRQTILRQWVIADGRMGDGLWTAIRRLPRGSGVLVLRELSAEERRKLRNWARLRALTVAFEASGDAVRVHDSRELRQALLARVQLILLSPLFPTRSHPAWRPLPRMRAAALARLAGRRLVALGGMNERKFARVKPLGFQAWAGIDAFRT
jgi:thiamine-phosphate pyrophosphorylase